MTIAGRTLINVLFYTDHHYITLSVPPAGMSLDGSATELGLGILSELLSADVDIFTSIRVTLLSRYNFGGSYDMPTIDGAVNKLTRDVLEKYDEVWFFGRGMRDNLHYDPTIGGPENVLTQEEVEALRHWMNYGGVLMTGDHANNAPSPGAPTQLIGLGAALGMRVPRAGSLRSWFGPPASTDTNISTLVQRRREVASVFDDQSDATPQTIQPALSRLFPERYHMLFVGHSGSHGQLINVFPDHMHEGKLTLPDPDTSPPEVLAQWPTLHGFRPLPEVAATGWARIADRDPLVPHELVAAYDGDQGGVGRIVADSTWHHYMNTNLVGFRDANRIVPGQPIPRFRDDTLIRLRDYYRNLAVFLAPRSTRVSMLNHGLVWVVRHPLIQEIAGASLAQLGEAASQLLSKAFTGGVLFDLLRLPVRGSAVAYLSKTFGHVPLPPDHVVLGGMLQELTATGSRAILDKPDDDSVLSAGFRRGLAFHTARQAASYATAKETERSFMVERDT